MPKPPSMTLPASLSPSTVPVNSSFHQPSFGDPFEAPKPITRGTGVQVGRARRWLTGFPMVDDAMARNGRLGNVNSFGNPHPGESLHAVQSQEYRRASTSCGVQLGGYRGTTMTKAIRKAASEAITKRAQARAADLAPTSPSYRWPAPGHCGPSQPA